jgi:hypothetical protein
MGKLCRKSETSLHLSHEKEKNKKTLCNIVGAVLSNLFAINILSIVHKVNIPAKVPLKPAIWGHFPAISRQIRAFSRHFPLFWNLKIPAASCRRLN